MNVSGCTLPKAAGGKLCSTTFLSTPSARRATRLRRRPRPCWRNFYPRPPRGGRRQHQSRGQRPSSYFYPRPPRGGRPPALFHAGGVLDISIHALREEGDRAFSSRKSASLHFYPRPPRGGRHIGMVRWGSRETFLSTPSARRATRERVESKSKMANFYPRPPRGGRPERREAETV